MADLIDALSRDSSSFDFFQAVRLLEEYFRKTRNDMSALRSGRVHFVPDPSTVFPASDISGFEGDDKSVRMFLTFMGLVGSSSPLPNYFSDFIARYPEQATALADFCAIFNHRMYALFYEAFCKYRFCLAAGSESFLQKLSCLAGRPAAAPENPWRMLAYAGVLSSRRRSARGLETVLSDYFGGIPVTVKQNFPRWAPVANPTKLGSEARLGVDATAGTEVYDIAGKVRVSVGPLKRAAFETFLEGSENAARIKKMISGYVSDPLDFDIEVRLGASELMPVILGANDARLGQTTSLGRNSAVTGDAYAVVLEGT